MSKIKDIFSLVMIILQLGLSVCLVVNLLYNNHQQVTELLGFLIMSELWFVNRKLEDRK